MYYSTTYNYRQSFLEPLQNSLLVAPALIDRVKPNFRYCSILKKGWYLQYNYEVNLRSKYLQIAQNIKNVLETTERWPFFDIFFSFHPLYYKTPFFLCSVWHDTHYEAGGWHQDNLHSLWQPLLQQTSWRVSKTLNRMFTLTLLL